MFVVNKLFFLVDHIIHEPVEKTFLVLDMLNEMEVHFSYLEQV